LERQTPSPRLARRSEEDFGRLAVACDMAVLRALELVGNRISRAGDRSRRGTMLRAGVGKSDVHVHWGPEPGMVDAALSGAWDVLPRLVSEHGCCSLVEPALAAVLDGYVRELVSARAPHTFGALEARLREAAGGVA
jgi:hypothetical protein